MQFGGRAAVGGRIGRLRRRGSAEGLQGQAAGNGAGRSRRPRGVSRRRVGLAGADQCSVVRGGGASGVALAGVEDGKDLDRPGDAVDEDVVGMDHRLAGAGDAAGAVDIGVIRQRLRCVPDRDDQPLRGGEISRRDIVGDCQQVASSVVRPDERQRHRGRCCSMISCTIAMT